MRPLFAITFIAIFAVLAVGTFVEQAYGSDFATRNVYHSAWFIALWVLLAVQSAVIIVRRRLWRRLAVFTLHLSFLFILAGAAITFLTSRSGVLHIREGNTANMFLDDSRQMQPLPFGVRLDSFRIQYYPGTQAPADYLSHVTLLSPDSTLHTPHSTLISMNRILRNSGYRLYQSSYDDDLKGTLLTVKYDPVGTPVTYTGYALMALSMIWVLMSKKERFRRLLRQVMSARALPVYTLLFICSASLQARSLPTVNDVKADGLARRQIVYNGRIAPFSTLAHDFMLKIYGRTTYHNLSAEQVTYGWMMRPEAWKHEPMIKVKDKALLRALGAEGQYISLQSLFDENGSYKLSRLLAPSPASSLHTLQKSLQDLDEKVGIIIMLTQGTLFTPLPKGATPLSNTRVEAEILYNRLPIVKTLFIFNLTLGILSLIFFAINGTSQTHPTPHTPHSKRFFILHSSFNLSLLLLLCFYALRWYVSGHIPLGNGYETMLFMSVVIMLVSAGICRSIPFVLCPGFLMSGLTLLVAHISDSNPQITHLMPVLNSPLLSLHVSVIMMAYALLAMTFIIAVIYFIAQRLRQFIIRNSSLLIQHSTLNTQHSKRFFILHSSFTLSLLLLYPALFLLAIGIFLGAVWANVSWGAYWSWDPKEIWALITMLIYSIPLHIKKFHTPSRLTPHSSFHAFMLLAFLTVLMTYFGVNFFLGGMHSYA